MGFIIDFALDPKEAFARGFMRGLASPVILFVHNEAPSLPGVQRVEPPASGREIAAALASDWARIGESMHRAVHRHEQGQQASPDTGRSSGKQGDGAGRRQG
ncbi:MULTISPECIES: hypothetical protein [unclassified Rhizobacter]|uniref:hypothetical protein n=1 Tax=unclassified Rhizobacter TaxID=2640088 RepID=UPI0006F7EB8F|nr:MULTISPECIES: hypothetical protein [unclassified Rhizobacter]KQU75936.1 hypothetical protein ASC88_23775 [Rhizobacter sp. Root29]KQW06086.1 hypothetical protein ASC98_26225 [Rhizobacter sp. Root1238]KRB19435.1 hypothetical protein ASE08_24075 [Rhizobacter sp. Root16D2]